MKPITVILACIVFAGSTVAAVDAARAAEPVTERMQIQARIDSGAGQGDMTQQRTQQRQRLHQSDAKNAAMKYQHRLRDAALHENGQGGKGAQTKGAGAGQSKGAGLGKANKGNGLGQGNKGGGFGQANKGAGLGQGEMRRDRARDQQRDMKERRAQHRDQRGDKQQGGGKQCKGGC